MSTKKRQYNTKKQILRRIFPLILAVIAVTAAAGITARIADQKKLKEKTAATMQEIPEDAIEIDGEWYVPKKNIETYLFMGLDTQAEPENSDNKGQCDTLQLVVLDRSANTYTVLPINRDTMTEVSTLDEEGYYLSSATLQIALAHASGDGAEKSCENTVNAVSALFSAQDIDGYASLEMSAVKTLNHLAGGVRVTIEDDFSQADASLKKGETVTLTDEQAMQFVRGRTNVGDGTNEGRMRRQEQYLSALKPILLEKCREDNSFALTLYDELDEYMVTNCSRNDFIRLAAALTEAQEGETVRLEGVSEVGESGFNEFTVDEDSLEKVRLSLFYDKVQEKY